MRRGTLPGPHARPRLRRGFAARRIGRARSGGTQSDRRTRLCPGRHAGNDFAVLLDAHRPLTIVASAWKKVAVEPGAVGRILCRAALLLSRFQRFRFCPRIPVPANRHFPGGLFILTRRSEHASKHRDICAPRRVLGQARRASINLDFAINRLSLGVAIDIVCGASTVLN
jgi:hypothetical protein